MKELGMSYSVPTISLHGDDNDLEDSRMRSESFLEMMRQNVPSVARIPSPKPHRRHHHHQKSSKSPSSQRKEYSNKESDSNHRLPVENQLRYRSHSDGALTTNKEQHHHHHHSNHKKMERSLSPLYIQEVSDRQKCSNSMEREDSLDDGPKLKFPLSPDTDETDGEITTISREIMVDNSSPDNIVTTSSSDDNDKSGGDETLTKRRDELICEVRKNQTSRSKKRTLKMIDQLLEQCADNFNVVERDIDFEFTRLHAALESRKKELIEEARRIRDKKIESLKESKQICLSSSTTARSMTKLQEGLSFLNIGSSDNDSDESTSTSSSRRNSIEQEMCLQQNGILEPWKMNGPDDLKDHEPQQHQNGILEPWKVAVPQQKQQQQQTNNELCGTLEEGNTVFEFNDESMETFSSIGSLKSSLSSPQFSVAKGLQYGIALVGETVRFEVHTKNTRNEIEFNSCDDIKCQIIGIIGKVTDVTRQVALQRSLSNGRVVSSTSSQTSLHKFYSYVFTPQEAGKYEVRITINGVEMKSSPYACSVYPKVNLTFDVKSSPGEKSEINLLKTTPETVSSMKCTSTLESRRQAMTSFRQNSEESDWVDESWIIQKGDKSSILRSVNDMPSYIYAMPSVKGFCAWKVRVTSACDSIDLSIGVGTRSGIPDIDEHFACDFPNNDRTKPQSNGGGRMQVRRTSSFTRVSTTYNVLLSTQEGIVRVICEQHEKDKTVKIDPSILQKFEFYPFISMTHRHAQCSRQVCPRPQITLL